MNIAHYRGDCRPIDPDALVGPDTAGAFYRPVSADYDAERDWTTIRYRPVVTDLPPWAQLASAAVRNVDAMLAHRTTSLRHAWRSAPGARNGR